MNGEPLHISAAKSDAYVNPFIVPSASPTPTHRDAAVTTIIQMDPVEDTDDNASVPGSSAAGGDHDHQRDARHAQPRHEHDAHHSNSERQRTQSTGVSGSRIGVPRPSLSTYQLASAALRRLPVRSAPNTEVTTSGSPLHGGAPVHTDKSTSAASSSSRPLASLLSSSISPVKATSPFVHSRFQVPPSTTPPPSASSGSHAATAGSGSAAARAAASSAAAHSNAPTQSASATHSKSGEENECEDVDNEEEDVEEEDDDDDDDDVAARVLTSLQHKDSLIRQLTHAVSTLEQENNALRRTADSSLMIDRSTRQDRDGLEGGQAGMKASPPPRVATHRSSNNNTHMSGVQANHTATTATALLTASTSGDSGRSAVKKVTLTPEAQRNRTAALHSPSSRSLFNSPDLPITPVRWWKQRQEQQLTESPASTAAVEKRIEHTRTLNSGAVTSRHSTHPVSKGDVMPDNAAAVDAPSLAAAHAAVHTVAALQAALAEKEEALAAMSTRLAALTSREKESQPSHQGNQGTGLTRQGVRDLQHKCDDDESDTSNNNNTCSSSRSSSSSRRRGNDDGSPSPALEAAQSRVAQLEYQLDTLQEERREDQRTLQEHIHHLTGELHSKSKELRRHERQHKAELAGLRQEVAALAEQMEQQQQQRSSSAVSATQMAALQQQLQSSQSREQQLQRQLAEQRRAWRQELEQQQRLLQEARVAAQEAEAAQTAQHDAECASLKQQAEKTRDDLEAQLRHWQQLASQAHKDLSELRGVHQRTEETVAVQRVSMQEMTQNLAAATLRHTHVEALLEQQERQLNVLRQRVQQLETDVASREAELEAVRQERDAESAAMTQARADEQSRLLEQVEGCMKGSEAVEAALLQAEARRRETAAQLTTALSERDAFRRQLREQSVQAQAQILEHQQLCSEACDDLRRQLEEAQRQVTDSESVLDTTQRELRKAVERARQLEDERDAAMKEEAQLRDQLCSSDAAVNQTTAQLLETKEALREALQAQLRLTNSKQQAEQQVSALRQAAQRSAERQQQEWQALQAIADTLSRCEVSEVTAPPSAVQLSMLAAPSAARATRTTAAAVEAAAVSAKHRIVQVTARDAAVAAVTSRSSSSASSSSSSSSSSSQTSTTTARVSSQNSTAESVAMSAVKSSRTDPCLAASSIYEEDEPQRFHHSETLAGHADTNARVRVEKDAQAGSRLSASHGEFFSIPSPRNTIHNSIHSGNIIKGTAERSGSVLRTLAAMHTRVQQLVSAHTALQHEVSAKRAAVRALVKERKAQQRQLQDIMDAMRTQQQDAERQHKEATKALNAERRAALEKLTQELSDRHAAEMAERVAELCRQAEAEQQGLMHRCAAQVQAPLMAFIRRLPYAVCESLALATMPTVIEYTTPYQQTSLAGDDRHCYAYAHASPRNVGSTSQYSSASPNYAAQYGAFLSNGQSPPTAAADASSSMPHTWDVQPELQADCDAIAREVLGLAGGYADLTNALTESLSQTPPSPASAAAAAARAGQAASPFPMHVDAVYLRHNNSFDGERRAPVEVGAAVGRWDEGNVGGEEGEHETVAPTTVLHPQCAPQWAGAELAALESALNDHLHYRIATLLNADVHLHRDERLGYDFKARPSASTTLPSSPLPPATAAAVAESSSREYVTGNRAVETDLPVAQGLARWIESLRQPAPTAALHDQRHPQQLSVHGALASTKDAGTDRSDIDLVGDLLSTCLAHVMRSTLQTCVAHVSC